MKTTLVTVSTPQFAFLREFLKRRSGVVLDENKLYLVVARLLPVMRQRGIASLDALLDRIRTASDPAIERDILNAMMTHETSFFRDKATF